MDDTYNSNIYLAPNDLNTIENKINETTNNIKTYIFNSTTSALSNIYVNANLNGKTLYLSFPPNISLNVIGTDNVLKTDNDNTITTMLTQSSSKIVINYRGNTYNLYIKNTDLEANVCKFKLPYDFGIVTNINSNNRAFGYIKFYLNENTIPNYVKHTWVENELPSMQKIDNIIKGINNIAEYYFKPKGWINVDEWLKTSNITNNDKNMNTKPISYQDLNNWVNDLNLINFDNLNELTVWNSSISEINWNEENDTEWEDL